MKIKNRLGISKNQIFLWNSKFHFRHVLLLIKALFFIYKKKIKSNKVLSKIRLSKKTLNFKPRKHLFETRVAFFVKNVVEFWPTVRIQLLVNSGAIVLFSRISHFHSIFKFENLSFRKLLQYSQVWDVLILKGHKHSFKSKLLKKKNKMNICWFFSNLRSYFQLCLTWLDHANMVKHVRNS